MRVVHRISLTNSEAKDVSKILESYGIPYNAGKFLCSFDIGECEEYEQNILEYCQKNHAVDLMHTEYDQTEYENASWYTLRSMWRWSYPQPESKHEYRDLVYNFLCTTCECGKSQKDLFRVRCAPKWGTKKYFAMLYWIGDELFASDKCVEMLQRYQITGFEFLDVLHYKKGEKIPDLNQLKVTNAIPESVDKNGPGIRSIGHCPQCGSTLILANGRPLMWDKRAFDGLEHDVYKTTDLFGETFGSHRLLISKRFYSMLQAEKATRSLVIEPVFFSET